MKVRYLYCPIVDIFTKTFYEKFKIHFRLPNSAILVPFNWIFLIVKPVVLITVLKIVLK